MPSGTTAGGDPGATVAAHDIARLANVGRAAVSNWRRRFPDFPEPVGGSSASPLYSLAEVEAWLVRHGKRFTLQPGDRVWQQVRGVADDLALGDLVGTVGAFLVFLRRAPKRWKRLAGEPDEVVAERLTEEMADAVPDIPRGPDTALDSGWVGTLRLVAEAVDTQDDRQLFDFLCERYRQVHSRRYAAVTPTQVAELMVELVDLRGAVVLDPACGIGTLLRAAHTAGAARLGGQEIDPVSARLTAARLLLHGTAVRVVVGDSLRADAFRDERADVVLCDPPFNERSWGYDELVSDPRWAYGLPPRGEPELAWVQHCLARVKPGGWVLLLMPASVATRRAGRRIRANLLRAGALRAVISLPGNTVGTVPPDLWVLRRPLDGEQPPATLLLVDAAEGLSVAGRAWRAYHAGFGGGTASDSAGANGLPAASRSVRIIDLLDDEVDIGPARQVRAADPGAQGRALAPAMAELRAALASLAQALPALTVCDDAPPARSMTSVGELVRAGVVALHQAPLRMVVDEGGHPVLTVNDVQLGRAPSGRAASGPGLVAIEPGDVIVPVTPREPVARVADDTDAGALLGPQLFLFRADPERLDPHFLAGYLRTAQVQGGSRSSSLLARTDVRRTPIPRLPLPEQREYGKAFRQLVAFADTLRKTTVLGESVIRLGFTGLADGIVRPFVPR
jgi:hypothetical protein